MKKIWRRIGSVLIALSLLITGLMLFVNNKPVYGTDSITVHFKWESGNPNVYYWDVNGTTNNPVAWPGVQMTSEGNDWYSYTIDNASESNIIFEYNGWQTSDMSRTEGEWWFMDGIWYEENPEAQVDDQVIIHFRTSWDKANIYYWNTNGLSNNPVSWPGTAMEKTADGWYNYTINNAKSVNLIFNNGTSQTGDLYREAGEWWYANNTWYDYNPYEPETTTQIETESDTVETTSVDAGIKVHFKSTWGGAKIYYWKASPELSAVNWPGTDMINEGNNWYTYNFAQTTSINLIFNYNGQQTADLSRTTGEWWFMDNKWYSYNPEGETTTTETESETEETQETTSADKIQVHFKSTWGGAKIYYWKASPELPSINWPGNEMISEGNNWYGYTFEGINSINLIFNYNGQQTADLSRTTGEWWYKGDKWYSYDPEKEDPTTETTTQETSTDETTGETHEYNRTDFRDETIYFVMTTRFYDGDSSNNVHCWDDTKAGNPDSDPAWRGDFKGLIEKLDYIKALGFTAIWITPVVENASGYDYHGYHAFNISKVDSRYESSDTDYQKLIDEVHKRDMKIIQDVVLNHTGNFGEENLLKIFEKSGDLSLVGCMKAISSELGLRYYELDPDAQYQARLALLKNTDGVNHDVNNIYHHYGNFNWDEYDSQLAQIDGDCVDLNTENPLVYNYLINSYTKFINMGVDGFRIDTAKHISRLTFNKVFNDAFKNAGGENFFMFGEVCARDRNVWYRNTPGLSTPFYTWKESKDYPWSLDQASNLALTEQEFNDNRDVNAQPTSNNAFLSGNNYHSVDYSMKSGLDVIDFPMHWNFEDARSAFSVAVGGDKYYNDATWNVTYVDSHDYAPDCAPEKQRFAKSQDTWAENLNLMFTFRGIPCIYYGSEIEFMKGSPIDPGPTAPLSTTGRAYFGDYIEGSIDVSDFAQYSNATGKIAETLNYPLSLHIQRLNKIRAAIPALRKGQYSTEGVSGDLSFKRRYTNTSEGVDSFVCVSLTDGATFSGVPNGRYVDAITGNVKNVTNGTLVVEGTSKGNMRVYVLDTALTKAPGKVGVSGTYLK